MKTRYIIATYIGLDACTKEEAEKAQKAIFAGIWDLIPDHAEPAISCVLFGKAGPLHRIETDKKIRRAK